MQIRLRIHPRSVKIAAPADFLAPKSGYQNEFRGRNAHLTLWLDPPFFVEVVPPCLKLTFKLYNFCTTSRRRLLGRYCYYRFGSNGETVPILQWILDYRHGRDFKGVGSEMDSSDTLNVRESRPQAADRLHFLCMPSRVVVD